jgi:hypothetical protein
MYQRCTLLVAQKFTQKVEMKPRENVQILIFLPKNAFIFYGIR